MSPTQFDEWFDAEYMQDDDSSYGEIAQKILDNLQYLGGRQPAWLKFCVKYLLEYDDAIVQNLSRISQDLSFSRTTASEYIRKMEKQGLAECSMVEGGGRGWVLQVKTDPDKVLLYLKKLLRPYAGQIATPSSGAAL